MARFHYVNGDLFEGRLRIFSFNAPMRGEMLDVCRFDWSKLSPAIFGALFQSVMDPAERRALGCALYDREEHPQGRESTRERCGKWIRAFMA